MYIVVNNFGKLAHELPVIVFCVIGSSFSLSHRVFFRREWGEAKSPPSPPRRFCVPPLSISN